MSNNHNHNSDGGSGGGGETPSSSTATKRVSIGGRQRGENSGANNFSAESEALDQIAKERSANSDGWMQFITPCSGQSSCTNLFPPSDVLHDRVQEAEARLAARRQARYEAKNIRLKELEKKQKEQEQNHSGTNNDNGSSGGGGGSGGGGSSGPSSSVYPEGVRLREERMRAAKNLQSSRRSSTDSSEDGFNLNVRDLRNELRDVEEKFKKAMVANATLDNDKAQLTYQVEALKDRMEESEERMALINREMREKNRDLEVTKRGYAETKRAVQLLQAQLDEQARLLAERGLVLVGQGEGEGEDGDEESASSTPAVSDADQEQRTRAIVSAETAAILSGLGKGPLDTRIKRLAEERDDLQDEVRRLKLDFEEERSRTDRLERRTPAFTEEEADWETKKIIDDYKFRVQKAEQDMATMQTNVARLESQVVRYRTAAETAERAEEELKTERRKLQREAREAAARIEELETSNKHLETRLGKLKTAKSNLLKEL